MAGSRRWITREEIAEIYDARADKAIRTDEGEPLDLMAQADQIRAIERLDNPIGARTA